MRGVHAVCDSLAVTARCQHRGTWVLCNLQQNLLLVMDPLTRTHIAF